MHPYLSDRNWFQFKVNTPESQDKSKEIRIRLVVDPVGQVYRLMRNDLTVVHHPLTISRFGEKTIFFELKQRSGGYDLLFPNQKTLSIDLDYKIETLEASQWLDIQCYRGTGSHKKPYTITLLDSITNKLFTDTSISESSDDDEVKSDNEITIKDLEKESLSQKQTTHIVSKTDDKSSTKTHLDTTHVETKTSNTTQESEDPFLDIEPVKNNGLVDFQTAFDITSISDSDSEASSEPDIINIHPIQDTSKLLPVPEYLSKTQLSRKIKLSFCTTCLKRLTQIQMSLPQNLQDNLKYQDRIEFVVVDFGTPGLYEWIYANFKWALANGYLRYLRTDKMPHWHASIAKNTSHKIARGDILVNLDCDNFTGANGAEHILKIFQKYGNDILFHQWSGISKDGTYGRISYHRKTFFKLGGYDESFLPMGYQDHDIIMRFQTLYRNQSRNRPRGMRRENHTHGYYSYDNLVLRREETRVLLRQNFSRAIPNGKGKSMVNTEYHKKLKWSEMNRINQQKSHHNLMNNKTRVNSNRDCLGVLL